MWDRLRSRITPNSSVARNVLILSGATLFAQILNVLSLPILTRLFSPQDFGHFAVYAALLGIAVVAAGLRFDLAISLPESDDDAMNLVLLAMGSAIVVALGFWLIWTLLEIMTVGSYNLDQSIAAQYTWAVSLGILLVGFNTALQAWSARKKRYALIAKSRLTQAVAGVGTNTAFGLTAPSPTGLVLGHLAYSGIGILSLLKDLWRQDRAILQSVSIAKIKEQALKFKAFPIYSVPEAFFNAGGWHVPILIMSVYLVTAELGQLMLATRLIGLPMVLLGQSVAQVYIAEAPRRARDGTLHAFTRQTMRTLAKVAAIPILGLGLLSPFLFPIAFGQDWARAGEIVAWLAPWYLVQIIASPVSTALHVLGQLRLSMFIQLGGMILRVAATWATIVIAPRWTIEAYAISGIIVYVIQIYLIDLNLRKPQGAA